MTAARPGTEPAVAGNVVAKSLFRRLGMFAVWGVVVISAGIAFLGWSVRYQPVVYGPITAVGTTGARPPLANSALGKHYGSFAMVIDSTKTSFSLFASVKNNGSFTISVRSAWVEPGQGPVKAATAPVLASRYLGSTPLPIRGGVSVAPHKSLFLLIPVEETGCVPVLPSYDENSLADWLTIDRFVLSYQVMGQDRTVPIMFAHPYILPRPGPC
ncbi:MAG: hypothetical protein ACLQK4_14345 [Acidimicrobiales bacterium]